MATANENMKVFEDTKIFLARIDLIDAYNLRAKMVVEYMERSGEGDGYFCVARSQAVDSNFSLRVCKHVDANKNEIWEMTEFVNNGATYTIGKLEKKANVENFRELAIKAIDYAEQNGGNLSQKRDRFREVFPGQVNVFLCKGNENESAFYGSYSWNCYLGQMRGDTKYIVWLYG